MCASLEEFVVAQGQCGDSALPVVCHQHRPTAYAREEKMGLSNRRNICSAQGLPEPEEVLDFDFCWWFPPPYFVPSVLGVLVLFFSSVCVVLVFVLGFLFVWVFLKNFKWPLASTAFYIKELHNWIHAL